MLERLARPDVEAFVVEAAGLQSVTYRRGERERRAGSTCFSFPASAGVGSAPMRARALARHLRDERGWPQVTVDPYTWNERAIRAWRKAGFVDVEERPADDEHSARWLLMVWSG